MCSVHANTSLPSRYNFVYGNLKLASILMLRE
jgi:hypothetical protein